MVRLDCGRHCLAEPVVGLIQQSHHRRQPTQVAEGAGFGRTITGGVETDLGCGQLVVGCTQVPGADQHQTSLVVQASQVGADAMWLGVVEHGEGFVLSPSSTENHCECALHVRCELSVVSARLDTPFEESYGISNFVVLE